MQIVYVSCVRLCYWLSLEARAINILSLWHLLLIRRLWPQSLCLCTEKCFTHLASGLKVWILFVSHLCTKSSGNICRFAVLYFCFSFLFLLMHSGAFLRLIISFSLVFLFASISWSWDFFSCWWTKEKGLNSGQYNQAFSVVDCGFVWRVYLEFEGGLPVIRQIYLTRYILLTSQAFPSVWWKPCVCLSKMIA